MHKSNNDELWSRWGGYMLEHFFRRALSLLESPLVFWQPHGDDSSFRGAGEQILLPLDSCFPVSLGLGAKLS